MEVRMVFPDPKCFSQENDLGAVVRPEQVAVGSSNVFAFERAEYPQEGGIERYFHGCLYPEKGFQFPQAIYACNMSKRYLVGFINLFGKNKFVLLAGMLKKSFLNDLLKTYNDAADMNLAPFYYNTEYPRYYSKACKEIKNFVEVFLKEIGVDEEIGNHFAKIFITLIDNDNAYRYRIQDVAEVYHFISLVRDDFIKNLDFTLKEYLLRESPHTGGINQAMHDKATSLVKIIKLAWHIPRFRKAVVNALKAVNWSNLIMDEADIYFTELWLDYDFRGESFETRKAKFIARHDSDKLPIMISYKVQ